MEITENSMKLRRQYVTPQITEVVSLADGPLLGDSGFEIGDGGYEEDLFGAKAGSKWEDEELDDDYDLWKPGF